MEDIRKSFMDKEFFKNNIKDLTIEELTTIKNWLLENPNYVNQI